MATTGIANFTLTRDDVIKASLRLLRELGAGAVPTIEDYLNCNQALNIVLKAWQVRSIPLWKLVEIEFPLISGVTAYPIGLLGGRVVTEGLVIGSPGSGGIDGTYFANVLDDVNALLSTTVQYTVTNGELTSIEVANPFNESGGYIDPYLDTGIGPEFPPTAWVDIYLAGTQGLRPVRFRDAWLRIDSTGQDIPLSQIARQDYNQFGQKSQPGVPNQYWYDPKLDTGILTVYNAPSDLLRTFHGIVQIPIFDMVSTTDNFDLPQEWFQAVKWGLADELSLEYGCPPDVRGEVAAKASKFLEDCFNFSVDEASVYFSVDRSGR